MIPDQHSLTPLGYHLFEFQESIPFYICRKIHYYIWL
uniref:Uncharacterized protein n=1 Tax=Rhizophora mucronata TaxID=61149 RepID=A0A2P2QSD4_RHIMU